MPIASIFSDFGISTAGGAVVISSVVVTSVVVSGESVVVSSDVLVTFPLLQDTNAEKMKRKARNRDNNFFA